MWAQPWPLCVTCCELLCCSPKKNKVTSNHSSRATHILSHCWFCFSRLLHIPLLPDAMKPSVSLRLSATRNTRLESMQSAWSQAKSIHNEPGWNNTVGMIQLNLWKWNNTPRLPKRKWCCAEGEDSAIHILPSGCYCVILCQCGLNVTFACL